MPQDNKNMLFTPCRDLPAASLVLLITAGVLSAVGSYFLLSYLSTWCSMALFQLPSTSLIFMTQILPPIFSLLLAYAFLQLALRFMQPKEETAEACSIPEQLDPQEVLQAVAALSQEELSLLREIRDLLKENHRNG